MESLSKVRFEDSKSYIRSMDDLKASLYAQYTTVVPEALREIDLKRDSIYNAYL